MRLCPGNPGTEVLARVAKMYESGSVKTKVVDEREVILDVPYLLYLHVTHVIGFPNWLLFLHFTVQW
jgi:hypothetical protein